MPVSSQGWSERADSPLLALVDGAQPWARFGVRTVRVPQPPPVDRLLAGVAEVDITPPPGMPKAGHSRNAHDGNGFRTRLRARVIHLRCGTGSLALIQCDVLSGSAVVQHLVARAVAERTDVPLAGVMMGATHTHAAPGQFLGSDFYNHFAANRPGFDPAYTQFLVERLAAAVTEAVSTRRPARLALGGTEVWGFTRNRALDPHVHNRSVPDRRTEPQRKYAAVNPWLHMLRVDADAGDGGHEPLAVAVVFSAHSTAVSAHHREYSADLWGYLCEDLADRLETSGGRRPVVGGMQGTHGDVAPAIRPGAQVHLEAARLGRGIAARAAALHARLEPMLRDRVELAAGLREVDLDRSRTIEGVELAGRAALGAAQVAGAPENATPVLYRLPPFRRGHPKPFGGSGDQGAKWVLLSRWLQPRLLHGFPRVLPVQTWRIGDTVLVGLPFEVTVETGRRIAARVEAAVAQAGVARAVVTSLTNDYAGYATTAEEYARQYYEGGHTLYGPRTEPFLAAHAARLATETVSAGRVEEVLPERRFALRVHRHLARTQGGAARREQLGPARFTDPTPSVDGFWELRWRDAAPGNLRWHEPMARVEAAEGDGPWRQAVVDGHPVDDGRSSVSVVHLGVDDHGHRYAVRWWDPVLRAGWRHRFVLLAGGGGQELVTDPFD